MIRCEALKLDFILGDSQVYRNLTLYPLLIDRNGDFDYLTLDEAMRQGGIKIKEVGGGSVPELLVINDLERDVLIISGEELLGAKQNRTVNVSIMVAAGDSLNIPVSCTEKGRWHEGREGIRMKGVSDHWSLSGVRQVLNNSVSESLKMRGSYASDQQGVWKSINDSMLNLGVSSHTSAQSDIFEEKEEGIEDYLRYFGLIPDQAGVVGLINGQIVSLDLFGKKDTFSRMFGRLLRSYVVDAISEKGKAVQKDGRVEEFLEDLKTAKIKSHKAPGKGEHLVMEGRKQRGMALVVDESLLHLCSFKK